MIPGFNAIKPGFWIDLENPWMAGLSDGEVDCPIDGLGLVEIKCPWSGKDMTVGEMIKNKKAKFL